VIRSLVERHVGTPRLAMTGGSAELAAALREPSSTLAIQRCTAHKLRNLEAKAPVRLREEPAKDYRRMIYAETRGNDWLSLEWAGEHPRSGLIQERRIVRLAALYCAVAIIKMAINCLLIPHCGIIGAQ
jgi:hypothetical protein